MSSWRGKGKGVRIAAWLNKLLSGNLARWVKPGRGIEIRSTPEKGFTIWSSCAIRTPFVLQEDVLGGDAGGYVSVTAKQLAVLGSSSYGDYGVDIELDLRFTAGWYFNGQIVWATQHLGVWYVDSPGIFGLAGTVDTYPTVDVALGDGSVSVGGTYPTVETGNNVWLGWRGRTGPFLIVSKECPEL